MTKRLTFFACFAFVFALAFGACNADAGVITFDGLPSEYTPGVAFEFDVLIDDDDLFGFFVEITVTGGTTFDSSNFLITATEPTSGYVFDGFPVGFGFPPPSGARAGFFAASLAPGVLTAGDFLFDQTEAVDTTATGNNILMTVSATPLQNVGDLSISVTTAAINFDPFGSPAPNPTLPGPTTVGAPTATGVIPEPTSVAIWSLLGVTAFRTSRRQRKKSA